MDNMAEEFSFTLDGIKVVFKKTEGIFRAFKKYEEYCGYEEYGPNVNLYETTIINPPSCILDIEKQACCFLDFEILLNKYPGYPITGRTPHHYFTIDLSHYPNFVKLTLGYAKKHENQRLYNIHMANFFHHFYGCVTDPDFEKDSTMKIKKERNEEKKYNKVFYGFDTSSEEEIDEEIDTTDEGNKKVIKKYSRKIGGSLRKLK
jgi:hypothetical protein